jgi:eukaryotic-like serine/threonine-protein kinase
MISECTIIKPLVPGGQKTVELASHPLHGIVVIKKGNIEAKSSLQRIEREVDLLKQIDSPFFPKQLWYGLELTEKKFIIIEKHVSGEELLKKKDCFKTPSEIFSLLKILINALKIVWDKNIIHRDLNFRNILIREDNTPCIIDFGIARFTEMNSLTNSIYPSGPHTPGYAAPEQIQNLKHSIDIRTDFFNLGLIAVELYIGINPFNPELNNNQHHINENILNGTYKTDSEQIKKSALIDELAFLTLQVQPYNRFNSYQKFEKFINERLIR